MAEPPRDWRSALEWARGRPRLAWRTARALARGHYYKWKVRLQGRRVVIGRWFQVVGRLEIRGPGTVVFGDYCSVQSTPLAPTTIYTHAPDAVIRFGDQVRLTGTRIGCAERIEVGDWTGLADCRVMDTDFHDLEVYDRPRYNSTGISRPVTIGKNVWVASGAMVLKGVTVGDHAAVGAGAVVAKDVPALAVMFGNPARVIWRLRGPSDREGAGSAPSRHGSAPSGHPDAGGRTGGAGDEGGGGGQRAVSGARSPGIPRDPRG